MNPISLFIEEKVPEHYKDEYLERLLAVLNEDRDGVKYKKLTFSRLNLMLKKLGKSKKTWNRDIFIGNVLDSKSPSKFFWWVIKQPVDK